MSAVLLSPHHDDETLFAAFTIIRERPKVVVVLESHLQEQRGNTLDGEPITNAMRQQETIEALGELLLGPSLGGRRVQGPDLEFWPYRDDSPLDGADWDGIEDRVEALGADLGIHVYAPDPRDGAHEHHVALGKLAEHYVPPARLKLYTTYVGGDVRYAGPEPVEYEPEWVERKLRALACYRSQIGLWPRHFLASQDEWYA